jgi:hypothetical protein
MCSCSICPDMNGQLRRRVSFLFIVSFTFRAISDPPAISQEQFPGLENPGRQGDSRLCLVAPGMLLSLPSFRSVTSSSPPTPEPGWDANTLLIKQMLLTMSKVCFVLLQQNIIVWVVYKKQELISHDSGGKSKVIRLVSLVSGWSCSLLSRWCLRGEDHCVCTWQKAKGQKGPHLLSQDLS